MKKNISFLFFPVLWLIVAVGALAFVLGKPVVTVEPRSWQVSVEAEPLNVELNLGPEERIIISPREEPLAPAEPVLSVEEPSSSVSPPSPQEEWVRVAIIIDDMGLGRSTAAIRDLPAEITLSYLPYAPNLNEQVRDVLARGHEVMLHIPMEPIGTQDPGPDALLTSLPPEEIAARVSRALDSFHGYVGANNHMGSKFTKDKEKMEIVVQALRERGLFFVDSRTCSSSVAGSVARLAGVKTANRDVFLDDTVDAESIKAQLRELEAVARKKGKAVAICHPHAITLSLLGTWVQRAIGRGVRIVPVSELVQ